MEICSADIQFWRCSWKGVEKSKFTFIVSFDFSTPFQLHLEFWISAEQISILGTSVHALTNLYLRNERVFSRFSCFSKKPWLLPNLCTCMLSPQPTRFFTFCRVFAFTVSAETGARELPFRILEFTVSAETGAKCKKILDFPAVLHFPDRLLNTFVSKSHKMQQNAWFSSSSAFSGPFIKYVREQIAQNATKYLFFQQFCTFRTVHWIRSWANLTKCKKMLDFSILNPD